MKLTLPENIEARLSPQSTALHLAIGLFVSDETTLGQAAEIAGLNLPATVKAALGDIDDVRACTGTNARKHAALARIYYEGASEPSGVLLYIKSALTGDESPDVLNYRAEHPLFPQEPTSDQFFDEAQWESYRNLGEHSVTGLFSDPRAGFWLPTVL